MAQQDAGNEEEARLAENEMVGKMERYKPGKDYTVLPEFAGASKDEDHENHTPPQEFKD